MPEVDGSGGPRVGGPGYLGDLEGAIGAGEQQPVSVDVLDRVDLFIGFLSLLVKEADQPLSCIETCIPAVFEVYLYEVQQPFTVHNEKQVQFRVHVPVKVTDVFADLGLCECLYTIRRTYSPNSHVVGIRDSKQVLCLVYPTELQNAVHSVELWIYLTGVTTIRIDRIKTNLVMSHCG